jgi:hypothetical protein
MSKHPIQPLKGITGMLFTCILEDSNKKEIARIEAGGAKHPPLIVVNTPLGSQHFIFHRRKNLKDFHYRNIPALIVNLQAPGNAGKPGGLILPS